MSQKYFFVGIYRSPDQTNEEFDIQNIIDNNKDL